MLTATKRTCKIWAPDGPGGYVLGIATEPGSLGLSRGGNPLAEISGTLTAGGLFQAQRLDFSTGSTFAVGRPIEVVGEVAEAPGSWTAADLQPYRA